MSSRQGGVAFCISPRIELTTSGKHFSEQQWHLETIKPNERPDHLMGLHRYLDGS
jgi:hypothetical protein